MKILVTYEVEFEVEVPKEKILKAIKDSEDTFDLDERLDELAREFCPAITSTLNEAYDAEISGVYQTWIPDGSPYIFTVPEDDIDEVIWER